MRNDKEFEGGGVSLRTMKARWPNPRNDKALNDQGFALPNMAEA